MDSGVSLFPIIYIDCVKLESKKITFPKKLDSEEAHNDKSRNNIHNSKDWVFCIVRICWDKKIIGILIVAIRR